jgi:hypothetical protein
LLRLQLVYLQVLLDCFASFESLLSPSRSNHFGLQARTATNHQMHHGRYHSFRIRTW